MTPINIRRRGGLIKTSLCTLLPWCLKGVRRFLFWSHVTERCHRIKHDCFSNSIGWLVVCYEWVKQMKLFFKYSIRSSVAIIKIVCFTDIFYVLIQFILFARKASCGLTWACNLSLILIRFHVYIFHIVLECGFNKYYSYTKETDEISD